MKPSAETVREYLDYDPDTGVFRWRVSPSPNVKAGTIAGANCEGYRLIRVGGGRFKGHQLAWLYMTGEWASSQIDHRDMNRSNNRWSNLRLATPSQQRANIGKQANNTSGFKGVRWYQPTKKWNAQLRSHGHNKNLGYFKTPQEAHAAYCEEAKRVFGEFARGA